MLVIALIELGGDRHPVYYYYFLFVWFLAVPRGMRDLSSPTGDSTRAPCSGSVES